jgi:hypothetical protein
VPFRSSVSALNPVSPFSFVALFCVDPNHFALAVSLAVLPLANV